MSFCRRCFARKFLVFFLRGNSRYFPGESRKRYWVWNFVICDLLRTWTVALQSQFWSCSSRNLVQYIELNFARFFDLKSLIKPMIYSCTLAFSLTCYHAITRNGFYDAMIGNSMWDIINNLCKGIYINISKYVENFLNFFKYLEIFRCIFFIWILFNLFLNIYSKKKCMEKRKIFLKIY